MRSMKSALLVSSFGGPRSRSEIEPFLRALFSDRDAIRLPAGAILQAPLASWVARRRAPRSAAQYAEIGGASPITKTTKAQAAGLRDRLGSRGINAPVIIGMRYTSPTIAHAVDRAIELGIDRLVVLALYPQYSISTSGSAFNAVARRLSERGKGEIETDFIPAFYRLPGYLQAMAGRIVRALSDAPDDAHLLFSAHGVPVRYVRRLGDPYARQIQETIGLLLPRVETVLGRELDASLAWQSRVGPIRWLGPSTEEAIRSLAASGVRALVVVPISFVCDHLETLYEIDIEYARSARELGIKHFTRTEALDADSRFLDALADAVAPALRGAGRALCEICLLPLPAGGGGDQTCRECGYPRASWR